MTLPHVVLSGTITIDECQRHFAPFVWRDGDCIVKAERFYRERDGQAALIEMLVVDRGHAQKFFVHLSRRDEGITVRLEPLTDPEKTPGVRRALAAVADTLVQATGCAYGPSNIEEFLIRRREG